MHASHGVDISLKVSADECHNALGTQTIKLKI